MLETVHSLRLQYESIIGEKTPQNVFSLQRFRCMGCVKGRVEKRHGWKGNTNLTEKHGRTADSRLSSSWEIAALYTWLYLRHRSRRSCCGAI